MNDLFDYGLSNNAPCSSNMCCRMVE